MELNQGASSVVYHFTPARKPVGGIESLSYAVWRLVRSIWRPETEKSDEIQIYWLGADGMYAMTESSEVFKI